MADDLDGGRRRTRSRAFWAVVITGMALFMASLDNLVVTTALPVIREHLHAGLSGLQWTVNAYTLSFAVLLLSAAALGERFGRRRIFVLGIAVFTVASAAAALSPSITVLVVGPGRPGRRWGHDHAPVADPVERRRATGASQCRPRDLGGHRRRRRGYRPPGGRGDHERVVVAVHLLAERAYRRGVGPAGLAEVVRVPWGPAWTWWA